MTSRARQPTRRSVRGVLLALSGLVAVAYPVVVYLALGRWSARGVGLLLGGLWALALLLHLQTQRQGGVALRMAPAGLMLAVVILADERDALLLMPVLINTAMLLAFGYTLTTDRPMIERFARLLGADLDPPRRRHCRQATVAWCMLFVINAAMALALTLWAPIEWWTLYNGLIAYLLMGALAVAEIVVRRVRFREFTRFWPDRLLARLLPGEEASTR